VKAYRLHVFGRTPDRGRIESSRILECEDDAQAIRAAERLRDGRYVELWDKGRLVKAFEP
jgi:hypothetical protein